MSHPCPSLLLVEDYPALGRVLERFLQERGGLDVGAVVPSAEAALAYLSNPAREGPSPDLVVIDISLPGMSGIELVAELQRLYPELPCLMLSAHRRAGYVRQALDNGARGYVTKGDPPAIIEAVVQVLGGEIYLSDALRRTVYA